MFADKIYFFWRNIDIIESKLYDGFDYNFITNDDIMHTNLFLFVKVKTEHITFSLVISI